MASCDIVICGICESQHTTTYADSWCPECDEGLCSKCLNFHNVSKSTRNHGVISVDNYKQLPSPIANISPFCQQHERKFKNYCPQHESLLCPLCIQCNHANCIGILSLEKVIQTAKTSALFEGLDQNLKDIKMNVERVVKDRKQNIDEIKKQRQKFQNEIKQVRNKINDQLDTLENRINRDLFAAEKKVEAQIEDLLGKLAENTEKVDLFQKNISTIKEYASNLQAFLGSKMIETEIQRLEKFMQSIFDDGSLQKIDINFKIDDKISDVLSTVTSLGSISIKSSSPLLVMQKEKEKQAQIMSGQHSPAATFIDMKITLQRKYDTTAATGCSFSCTGDIVLIDNDRRRVLVLKEDGTFENNIHVSKQRPVDGSCIDEKTAAITIPASKQIQIINIIENTVEHTITTTGNCYGVCYRDGELIYCETGKGIQRVNLSDYGSSTLVKDTTLSNWSYVATSKDKIVFTNCLLNTVACHTRTGEKIWEYKDESVRSPHGISVDKDANVYIASSGNNSIILLSSDGKQTRKLLGHDDGIQSPYGLAFDVKKEKIIVASYNGSILYGIC